MRCSSWKDFEGRDLPLNKADEWRYAMRLRPRQGRFYLKLTDNRQALKFHTSKGLYLNRIDQSTTNLIRRLQRRASLQTAVDATKPGAAGEAKKTKKKDKKKRPA